MVLAAVSYHHMMLMVHFPVDQSDDVAACMRSAHWIDCPGNSTKSEFSALDSFSRQQHKNKAAGGCSSITSAVSMSPWRRRVMFLLLGRALVALAGSLPGGASSLCKRRIENWGHLGGLIAEGIRGAGPGDRLDPTGQAKGASGALGRHWRKRCGMRGGH